MSTGPASTPETPSVEAAALAAALHEFAREWADDLLACHLAEKLTCRELEALAGLLAALGEADAAQQWTEWHAFGDEDGALHFTP